MQGWNPKQHNPLTDAPQSPTIGGKAEPETGAGITINGQSVTLPWPFMVAEEDKNYPSIDILIQD